MSAPPAEEHIAAAATGEGESSLKKELEEEKVEGEAAAPVAEEVTAAPGETSAAVEENPGKEDTKEEK